MSIETTAAISRHGAWSLYEERSAQLGDGMIRWVESPDASYVIDIQAGRQTRGRQLLQWLATTVGHEIHAVGVVEDAECFWDRMEEDGLIKSQTEEDFMSFFGLRSQAAGTNLRERQMA